MDPHDPHDAHTIVADYLAVLDRHLEAGLHPAPLASLPHPKETIKTAFRSVVVALQASGALTEELRATLEQAYVALADYVAPELARLLHEYREAGAAVAADSRLGVEKVGTPAWKVLAESGRLAGSVAKAIAEEAAALRTEFRRFA